MRNFFKEHSDALVVIIVAVSLITICMGLKTVMGDSLIDLANNFTGRAQQIINFDESGGNEEDIEEEGATILINGFDFNVALKNAVSPSSSDTYEKEIEGVSITLPWNDLFTTSILFDKTFVKPASGYVELQESGEPVYAWYDSDIKTIKITSDADKIYANPDSSFMFCNYKGDKNKAFILDVSWFDTSKVTDMSFMFYSCVKNATTFTLTGLSSWNTSNVTDMRYAFYCCGSIAATFNLTGLSSWSTSKVTDMSYMFYGCGQNPTTFTLADMSNWNTSNVTDMHYMFSWCGFYSSSFSLVGLSNWNVDNVTNMHSMFESCNASASSVSLDLSNWNTSNVTDISRMFLFYGNASSSWTVKIPKKTGTLTNTTGKYYGKTSSVYCEPASDRSFTLVG